MPADEKFKCTKCQEELEIAKITPVSGATQCHECWLKGIDKEKVKELREQLGQYIDSNNKPRKGLDEEQLRRAKQIIKNNYFYEDDKRSKELINAMVFDPSEGIINNESVFKCLEEIEEEIRRLVLLRTPKKPRKYKLNCPTCGKEFSYESKPEKSYFASKQEADYILNEQLDEHIEKVHKVVESESKAPNPSEEKPKDKNFSQQQDSENKASLIVVTITLLLTGVTITCLLWNKNRNKRTKRAKKKTLSVSKR